MNLQGKTVIVTGAARGIGQRYAMRMAEIGMNVIAADKADCSETVKKCYGSGKAIACTVDVADMASVQKMVDLAVEKLGKIHVLVNNAALYGGLKGGRIEQLSEAEWDACMAVNVKGVWNCSKAVIPIMRKQGGGSIVNIASLAAVRGLPYSLHYATSKGAVIAMTRSMAR
ncbi:MAG: SDR family NAD(P)-dependent oxidoreductase, partial [Alphaproteobacteria bacterium]